MDRQILVPLDGSLTAEAALPHAVQFAHASGATLHLLRATIPAARSLHGPWWLPRMAFARWGAARRARAQRYLACVAARLRGTGLAVTTTVGEGDPAACIRVLAAATPHATTIVMAMGRSGAVRRWLFGSIAARVLRTLPAPILLIGARASHGVGAQTRWSLPAASYATLLVPIDGSGGDERALRQAVRLAARWHARLEVACVTAHDGTDDGLSQQAAARYLDAIAEQLGVTGVAIHVCQLAGASARVLDDHARRDHVDLIVLAREEGVAPLNSLARRLLHRSKTPVLVLPAEQEQRANTP